MHIFVINYLREKLIPALFILRSVAQFSPQNHIRAEEAYPKQGGPAVSGPVFFAYLGGIAR